MTANQLAVASRRLRKEREFSFSGDVDFVLTEEHGRDGAQRFGPVVELQHLSGPLPQQDEPPFMSDGSLCSQRSVFLPAAIPPPGCLLYHRSRSSRTTTGVFRLVVLPSPNWPYRLNPQANAVPSLLRATVWKPPAAMAATPESPLT